MEHGIIKNLSGKPVSSIYIPSTKETVLFNDYINIGDNYDRLVEQINNKAWKSIGCHKVQDKNKPSSK